MKGRVKQHTTEYFTSNANLQGAEFVINTLLHIQKERDVVLLAPFFLCKNIVVISFRIGKKIEDNGKESTFDTDCEEPKERFLLLFFFGSDFAQH